MRILPLSAFLVIALATVAAAQPSATRPDNYYAAGNRVDITAPMPADVIVAGRDVTIRQSVSGDIAAAGWRVELAGRADDDVRVAGSEIVVNAPVMGDVTMAGGTITLGPQSIIGGRSWITGNTVRIDGVLDRDVSVAAANVIVTGEIRQPTRIVAERLEIAKGARVWGPLTYRGPQPAIVADGAMVQGPVTYTRIAPREARRAREMPVASTLLFSIHLFLAGLLVIVFLPRTEASIVETLRRQPGKSALAGLTLVVTVPIAALFLILSVLGLPLGLVLAAMYAVLLFAGVLTTAFFVGEWEGRVLGSDTGMTRRRQVVLLLAGVLTLAVLRVLFGGFTVFVSMLFGFGALALWMYQSIVKSERAPAAA